MLSFIVFGNFYSCSNDRMFQLLNYLLEVHDSKFEMLQNLPFFGVKSDMWHVCSTWSDFRSLLALSQSEFNHLNHKIVKFWVYRLKFTVLLKKKNGFFFFWKEPIGNFILLVNILPVLYRNLLSIHAPYTWPSFYIPLHEYGLLFSFYR